jgi:hypothetical protein
MSYRSRPSVIRLNDSLFIRASSLNGCQRRLTQDLDTLFNGTVYPHEEPSQALIEAAQYGIDNEDRVVQSFVDQLPGEHEVLRGKKVTVFLCGEACTSNPALVVEGHVDAIVGEYLIEVKTVSSAVRAAAIRYRWLRQLAAYVHGYRAQGADVTPVLLELHRDTGDIQTRIIDTTELPSVEGLHSWLHGLVEMAKRGELAECECGYCAEVAPVQQGSVESMVIDTELVDRLITIDDEMKRLQEEKERIAQQLAKRYGYERVAGSRGYVVWSEATTVSRFDVKRHAEECGECHMRYITTQDRKPFIRIVRKGEP